MFKLSEKERDYFLKVAKAGREYWALYARLVQICARGWYRVTIFGAILWRLGFVK